MNGRFFWAAAVLLAAACWFAAASSADRTDPGPAALTDSARTAISDRASAIFKRSCAIAGCHAGAYPKARLSLESAATGASVRDVRSRQIDTLRLVDTRAPKRSYLLMKIRGDKGIRGERMPARAAALKADEIKILELWAAGLSAPAAGAKSAAAETTAVTKP